VTNDNGGTATTASVTLSATGPTSITGLSGAVAVTNAAVNAGTYTLAETALTGYTASAWSCTAGTLTGSSLVLTIGQTSTCTINNNDIGPTLTLVKTVTNDNGGTATTASVTLSATGPTSITGLSGAVAVTNAAVNAGTYTLAETALAGYTAGAWSCTAGTLTGSSLVLTIGQTSTCTINNNDIGPTLTLVKTVTNDNGGTATTSSVTLSATGPTTISGLSGAVAVTGATVSAGTYALAESALANYTAGAWSCTAGTLTGSSLVLVLGQTSTCTINNNDVAPRLTLVKTVTNDNGGTATTASVTLSATGPTSITGLSGAVAVTNAAVNAGTYTLVETALANYTAGAWSCTAGTLTGSSLVLTIGQTSTCTINNNDIGPTLTLVKTVTDTSGGPSTVSSFTLTATGPLTISGITGAAAVTSASVNAGTYALTETNLPGYTAGAWSCTSGSLTAANLTLSLGQTATCTINNIKLPTLTIRKISNGGIGGFGFSGSNGVTTQTINTTTAGSTFAGAAGVLTASATSTNITETMPASFWEIQATSCTGMGTGGTASLVGNTLTLDVAATAAGRNIVCTFTNRRLPTVTVQKTTTGGVGNGFAFADVNLTGSFANINTLVANTATPTTPTKLIATTVGTAVGLTETSPLSFVTAGATCSDANSAVSLNTNPVATSTTGAVTIPATAVRVGADINCIFTNALAVPSLAVTKSASVVSVSSAGTVVTYTIAVRNAGNTTLSNIGVTDPLGSVVCPSSGSATVTTLVAGAGENCSLSYTVPQSVLDANGGGDGDIDNTASAAATYNSAALSANGSATVGLIIAPALSVDKVANTAGPVGAGNIIGYTYRVTNTGNVTINNVTISDAHIGYGSAPVPGNETLFTDVAPLGNSTDAATNATWDRLAPGDVIVFSSTYAVVQADIDNLQ
jgi:large repetitive protein